MGASLPAPPGRETALDRPTRRPALFFDRDGVLNEDRNYVHKVADFAWIPGAPQAIRFLNDRGWLVFVVTNQSGVALGYYDEAAIHVLHAHMQAELARIGAHIDDFRHCPHHPKGEIAVYRQDCDCRKPGPGMIQDLLKAWPVDAAHSLLIGDKARDIESAEAAGIRGHLFSGGDLDAFVRRVVGEAASS